VIGVDASPIAVMSAPPLTTVEFNPRAVADAAVAAVGRADRHRPPDRAVVGLARKSTQLPQSNG
jgi:DNA-binding LacI/PurR family transcriptional regulator